MMTLLLHLPILSWWIGIDVSQVLSWCIKIIILCQKAVGYHSNTETIVLAMHIGIKQSSLGFAGMNLAYLSVSLILQQTCFVSSVDWLKNKITWTYTVSTRVDAQCVSDQVDAKQGDVRNTET